MSVIAFAADDVKTLETAARDLCGDHVGGSHWAEFYANNRNEYAEWYESRSLTAAERDELRREYAEARPRNLFNATIGSAAELMAQLQSLFLNCDADQLTAEDEQARRRVLDCVAFELMPMDGGAAVYLDTFASVQRVDFDTYRMSTIDPRFSLSKPYTFARLGGQPHPYEGLTVTDPAQLFRLVWQMHDDCAADYRAQDARYMAEFMALMDSGKSYRAATLEMLTRQSAN